MRIEELRFTAFGPFTDAVLDLSGPGQGLTLVYGPNEAGKSSALRALRCLLFGIPERSGDDFLHPYSRMRIGACLRSGGGRVLEVVRRKGRSNTLRAADDATVVEEAEIRSFLQGVDESLFSVMFGIGYPDLVRGGREILQGGGELGRLLFSAGSGIVNLREVQNDLASEADSLFKPSGQKPEINDALGRLKAARKALRDAQLPGGRWAEHSDALDRALKAKAGVEAELLGRRKEINRLERIRDALPLIARRTELTSELRLYADTVPLPEGFSEERRELLARLATEENRRAESLKNIESYRKDMAGLAPSAGLLENDDIIETLHRELGSRMKASKDRIGLETLRREYLSEAREILRGMREDLTIEQAGTLRIKKAEAMQIQRLGALYERIVTRIEEAKDRLPALSTKIDRVEEEIRGLDAPRPIEDLQAALAGAEEFGPLERQIRGELNDVESSLQGILLDQRRLGLEAMPTDTLEGLPVPPEETIGTFEERFETLARRLDDIEGETRKSRDLMVEVDRRIESHRLQQEVPDEEDLASARGMRDRGWRLIARELKEPGACRGEVEDYLRENPGSADLSGAFEANLQQADIIADRLRREADRVAAMAALTADRTALGTRLQQMEQERAALEREHTGNDEAWSLLWRQAGIQPHSPREMGRWVREFSAMAEKIGGLRGRRMKIDASRRDVELHRENLTRCLSALGVPADGSADSLTSLVKRAQASVQAQEALRRKRDELFREKARLETELVEARSRIEANEKELGDWQEEWEAAVRPIGLGPRTLPAEANTVMEDLKSLFEKLKESDILKKRIEGIDRDADAFAREVRDLVTVVAPDLSGRTPEESALELHRRLKEARDARSREETLLKHLRQEEARFDEAGEAVSGLKVRLQGMCSEAACVGIDELPEAERRSSRRREIESELDNTDAQLRRLSAGATVEVFAVEVLAEDPDSMAGEIERLQEVIQRLDQEKSSLDQAIGGERTELNRMDGSARAALLAEEIQLILAGLENRVEKYAMFKMAAKILDMAIERYRDKSQGPILERAAALFREITGGSFEGIRAEYDPRGQPVIVGVRPAGRGIVPVGGMSEGTADQLYLALRLAGLEEYLERNEPIPFIVDDILIMFDDERAAAALRALARLARKTQVIFFTHHRHLVALAEKTLEPADLICRFL